LLGLGLRCWGLDISFVVWRDVETGDLGERRRRRRVGIAPVEVEGKDVRDQVECVSRVCPILGVNRVSIFTNLRDFRFDELHGTRGWFDGSQFVM